MQRESVQVKHLSAIVCAFFLYAAAIAAAQVRYPVKPIKLIVASAAGGGPDITARIIAPKLADALGQSVVVDNRPGANGIIGSETAANAVADGYTLLLASAGSHAVNVGLYPKLSYDPLRDFAPITLIASAPNILIVHPALPVQNVAELIALARARPGQISFGSGGTGSTAHLSGEMFKSMAGIDIVHVPFKGSPAAVIAIISGEIGMGMPNIPPTLPHVRSGRLKALAVTTAKRSQTVPELPTVAESGLRDYEATAWFGLLAPAGTPQEVIVRLHAEAVKILRMPEIRSRYLTEGAEVVASSPDEFTAVMRRDIARWTKVVRQSGARPD